MTELSKNAKNIIFQRFEEINFNQQFKCLEASFTQAVSVYLLLMLRFALLERNIVEGQL